MKLPLPLHLFSAHYYPSTNHNPRIRNFPEFVWMWIRIRINDCVASLPPTVTFPAEINVREYRRGNHKWIIQRNWLHRVHKTKTKKTKTIQRNWQHRVHKTKTKKTKTIQRNWQHRVHKTKTKKTKTIQRNWQHRVHKTKTNNPKHDTICVRHYNAQTNTNNVNETWALLQTTGVKDEPHKYK